MAIIYCIFNKLSTKDLERKNICANDNINDIRLYYIKRCGLQSARYTIYASIIKWELASRIEVIFEKWNLTEASFIV